MSVIGGSTSKSLWVEMLDATTGKGKTGLAYTDITATYTRPGGSNTSITMATLAAITSSYSSGGFKEVTNGTYRFDPPDAAIATISGGGPVLFTFSATGCLSTNFQLIVTSANASSAVLTQTFPTNFAALSISAGGLVDILQTAADKVWGTTSRILTAGTNIVLPSGGLANVTAWTVAITGNITGNLSGSVGSVTGAVVLPTIPTDWIAAVGVKADAVTKIQTGLSTYAGGDTSGTTTLLSRVPTFPSNFSSLGISAGGKINGVVLADTLTTYTGNTVQTGDSFARIGVAGAGLTALGDARLANLNATVSSRSTYSGTSQTADVGALIPARLLMTSGRVWTLDDQGNSLADQLVALQAHGDENWESSGGGSGLSGPNSVTISFVDGSAAVVPLVEMSVIGQGTIRSNSSGVAAFGLNSGTYTIAAAPVGGVVFPNTSITVSGTFTQTITGASNSLTPPTDPQYCAVQGTLSLPGGAGPAAGVQITFRLTGAQYAVTTGGKGLVKSDVSVTTGSDGVFNINLERNDFILPTGTGWTAICEEIGLSKNLTLATGAYALTQTP